MLSVRGSAKGAEIISCLQVIFNLHPTFPNPTREVTTHPFEIEEHGWGEFELNVVVRIPYFSWRLLHACLPIEDAHVLPSDLRVVSVQLHFADDAQEQPVEINHKLKLYSESDPTNQSTKKPVQSHAFSLLHLNSWWIATIFAQPPVPSELSCPAFK